MRHIGHQEHIIAESVKDVSEKWTIIVRGKYFYYFGFFLYGSTGSYCCHSDIGLCKALSGKLFFMWTGLVGFVTSFLRPVQEYMYFSYIMPTIHQKLGKTRLPEETSPDCPLAELGCLKRP